MALAVALTPGYQFPTDGTAKLDATKLNLLGTPTAAISGTVTGDNVPDALITAAKLATDAVETAKIKDAQVTAAKLATDAVETAKIKDAQVTAAKLAADAVETAKIKDANVTAAKLALTQRAIYGTATYAGHTYTITTDLPAGTTLASISGMLIEVKIPVGGGNDGAALTVDLLDVAGTSLGTGPLYQGLNAIPNAYMIAQASRVLLIYRGDLFNFQLVGGVYIPPAVVSAKIIEITDTFANAAVTEPTAGNTTWTLATHGLNTGDAVQLRTGSGSLPTPFLYTGVYFVRTLTGDTFELYDTKANALDTFNTTGRIAATNTPGTNVYVSCVRLTNGSNCDYVCRVAAAGVTSAFTTGLYEIHFETSPFLGLYGVCAICNSAAAAAYTVGFYDAAPPSSTVCTLSVHKGSDGSYFSPALLRATLLSA